MHTLRGTMLLARRGISYDEEFHNEIYLQDGVHWIYSGKFVMTGSIRGGSSTSFPGSSDAPAPQSPTPASSSKPLPDMHGSSMPPRRTNPLQAHEIQESGYLLARRAVGRPIDNPEDLRRLTTANETINITRHSLKYGRGNVTNDYHFTEAQSNIRANASYQIDENYGNDNFVMAGSALALGAGNCDQNAAIAINMHGPKLKNKETVHTIGNNSMAHTWAELRAPKHPTVVMDPWSEGPAMEKNDTMLPKKYNTSTARQNQHGIFHEETGRTSEYEMRWWQNEFAVGDRSQEMKDAMFLSLYRRPTLPDWNPNQIANPKFAQQARTALEGKTDLSAQVMAVGIARHAYNMNVKQVAKQAPDINFSAQNLDHQTRPAPERLPYLGLDTVIPPPPVETLLPLKPSTYTDRRSQAEANEKLGDDALSDLNNLFDKN